MKITQDVRAYAEARGIADAEAALADGMAEKAKEFQTAGGELYQPD